MVFEVIPEGDLMGYRVNLDRKTVKRFGDVLGYVFDDNAAEIPRHIAGKNGFPVSPPCGKAIQNEFLSMVCLAAAPVAKKLAMEDSKQIISNTNDLFYYGTMWMMRTKHGYGKKRLLRFMDEFQDLLDSIQRGYLTLKDIQENIYNETKLDIQTNYGSIRQVPEVAGNRVEGGK